ncbi:MEDS domain-containing protein [Nocardioides sp. P5_C9_2]
MSAGPYGATANLDSLEPGTHLCAFHRDEDQLARIVSTFVGQGVSAGDQLLYITTEEQAALLRTRPDLQAHDALVAGQLLVRSFEDAYGRRRPDDLSTVADGFRAAAEQAQKNGFPGLRVAARMDGLAPLLGSRDEVLRWERMATGLQRELGVSSVCLYDASRLDEAFEAMLAHEHDGLAPELGETPLARFLAVDEPWGVRVSGEVDLSNRDVLHRVLVSRAAVTPRLHVDLAGVTFADVGSLSRMQSVAAGLPDGGCLVLHRVPAAVRRVLTVSRLGHERLRVEP